MQNQNLMCNTNNHFLLVKFQINFQWIGTKIVDSLRIIHEIDYLFIERSQFGITLIRALYETNVNSSNFLDFIQPNVQSVQKKSILIEKLVKNVPNLVPGKFLKFI